MMLHDAPWWSMMLHDAPWCFMMLHDAPWCHMKSYYVLWCHIFFFVILTFSRYETTKLLKYKSCTCSLWLVFTYINLFWLASHSCLLQHHNIFWLLSHCNHQLASEPWLCSLLHQSYKHMSLLSYDLSTDADE